MRENSKWAVHCCVSEDLPHRGNRARLVSKAVDVAKGHKIYLALDISNDLSKSEASKPPKMHSISQWKEASASFLPRKNSDVDVLFFFQILLCLLSVSSFQVRAALRVIESLKFFTLWSLIYVIKQVQLKIINEIINYNIFVRFTLTIKNKNIFFINTC